MEEESSQSSQSTTSKKEYEVEGIFDESKIQCTSFMIQKKYTTLLNGKITPSPAIPGNLLNISKKPKIKYVNGKPIKKKLGRKLRENFSLNSFMTFRKSILTPKIRRPKRS